MVAVLLSKIEVCERDSTLVSITTKGRGWRRKIGGGGGGGGHPDQPIKSVRVNFSKIHHLVIKFVSLSLSSENVDAGNRSEQCSQKYRHKIDSVVV